MFIYSIWNSFSCRLVKSWNLGQIQFVVQFSLFQVFLKCYKEWIHYFMALSSIGKQPAILKSSSNMHKQQTERNIWQNYNVQIKYFLQKSWSQAIHLERSNSLTNRKIPVYNPFLQRSSTCIKILAIHDCSIRSWAVYKFKLLKKHMY